MALLKSKKSITITGKNLNKLGTKAVNIKPKTTKKIINRYHFLIKCRAYIFQLLGIDLIKTDDEEINNYVKSYLSKNMKNVILDLKFEDELLNLRKKYQKNKKLSLHDKDTLYSILDFITKEIVDNGGLQKYQIASIMGQNSDRGGDSSKKLMEWILELNDSGKVFRDMKTLEIGCLRVDNILSKHKYKKFVNSIERIDLNSNHPEIKKEDFLLKPIPETNEQKFDLISCSLVVNFVPDENKRGEMMRRLKKFCRNQGLLFFVLPLPCVTNSRFTDDHVLVKNIMERGLNFKLLKEHKSNKIAYYLFQNNNSVYDEFFLHSNHGSRKNIRGKPGMNNFCITFG